MLMYYVSTEPVGVRRERKIPRCYRTVVSCHVVLAANSGPQDKAIFPTPGVAIFNVWL